MAVVLLMLASWARSENTLELTEAEQAYLANLSELTLCEQFDIYPLSGVRDGQVIGMRGDVVGEIVRLTGINIRAVGANSGAHMRELVSGNQCDLIGSMGSGAKVYDDYVSKTDTVMEFPYAVLGDLKSFNLDSFTDLSDRTFVVRFPNIGNTIKAAYPEVEIVVINDVDEAISRVSGNTHFVALRPVVERIIQEYGFQNYKFNGVLDKINQHSVIGVSKAYPDLLPIINRAIAAIEPSFFSFVRNKYSIREFQVVQSFAYLWYVLAILVIALVSLVYRARWLKRRNEIFENRNRVIEEQASLLVEREAELLRASKRVAVAADAAHCGFWTYNTETGINQWDDQIAAIWELEPGSLKGEALFTFWANSIDPEDRERVLAAEDRMAREGKDGDVFQHRFRITTAKGNPRWVEATFTVTRAQGETVFIGMSRDMTDEQALRDQLAQAADKALELAEAKSQFLANMSHEIRTPLNAVLGMAQLLVQPRKYPPEVISYAGKIVTAGNSLLRLLNDILDFSKIESKKLTLDLHPLRLSEIQENLALLMTSTARDKQLELIIQPLPERDIAVVGDSLRLEQILINLVGNAIKFTESGSVQLAIHKVGENPASDAINLRFVVSDTGIGMSAEQLDTVLEPFHQADDSITRRFGGTGLGLAIVQKLLELMGSHLEIESQPGRGSVFSFTLELPLSEIDATDKDDPLAVLVVDDNALARDAISRTVEVLGWHSQSAEGGEQAVKLFEEQLREGTHPSLVLVDWMMPDQDGAAVAREIKEIAQARGAETVPTVIMVTAYDQSQVEHSPDAAFVDLVVNKPLTAAGLKKAYATLKDTQAESLGLLTELSGELLRDKTLLVVDDNLFNRDVAKTILEGAGARVELAENGRQAVTWLQNSGSSVDAVLMDVQMPVLDGLEATKLLRQDERFNQLPFIGMSAGAYQSDIDNAMNAGMNAYLTKPINVQSALKTLAEQLGIDVASVVPASAQNSPVERNHAFFDGKAALAFWGSEEKVAHYLRLYVSEFNEMLDQGIDQISAATLHKLKGGAGTIYLYRLQTALKAAEWAIKQNEDSESALKELRLVWENTEPELVEYIQRYGQVDAPDAEIVIEPEIPGHKLQKLLDSMRGYNPDEVNEVLYPLMEKYPSHTLRQVGEAIAIFDFVTASDLVQAMIDR